MVTHEKWATSFICACSGLNMFVGGSARSAGCGDSKHPWLVASTDAKLKSKATVQVLHVALDSRME